MAYSSLRYSGYADTYEDEKEMEKQLLDAASKGCLRIVKSMARALNANKGEPMAHTIKRIHSPHGLTPLHVAASAGKTEICHHLIHHFRMPVDFPCPQGRTPLHYAAIEGRSATLAYLIDQGADPTATDNQCSTPLLYAAEYGRTEVLKLLLSKGVPVDPENHRGTPLHQAASHGEDIAMHILLQHGADINKLMNGISTPMHNAIMSGTLKCIKLLIKAGADLNFGCPLAMTVAENELEMMKCLLEARADPNIPDHVEHLPVEVAVRHDRKEMIEILFPLTSPIPQVKPWSVEGLYMHVNSYAYRKKLERIAEKRLADFKMKGREAFQKKDFLSAAAFYNMAISIDPTDGTLFANRSLCWLNTGAGERALEDARLAQSLKPDWPKAYYRVGAALMFLKDYEQASQVFLDGLKLDPANEDINKALQDSLDYVKKSEQSSEEGS